MFILRILVEARSIKRPSCRQIHGEISPKLKNQPSPVDPPPRANPREPRLPRLYAGVHYIVEKSVSAATRKLLGRAVRGEFEGIKVGRSRARARARSTQRATTCLAFIAAINYS
jgi:hypothetical protein